MEDQPVLDLEEARRVTDEAVIRVFLNSTPALRKLLLDAFCAVVMQQELFTSDDIWVYLGSVWERSLSKTQKSVLGQIVRDAIKDDLIVFTGDFELSARPRTHRCPKRVWRVVHWDDQ